MKIGLFLMALLGAAQALAQGDACFKALNPQVIQIQAEGSDEIQFGEEATLLLPRAADRPAEELAPIAKMKIKSLDLTIEVLSFLNPSLRSSSVAPRYSVECDGGNMTLAPRADGTLVANSGLIRGEARSTRDEGCSDVNMKFVDLVFEPMDCP